MTPGMRRLCLAIPCTDSAAAPYFPATSIRSFATRGATCEGRSRDRLKRRCTPMPLLACQLVFAALAISCAGCAAVTPDSKTSDDQSPTGTVPALQEMRDLTAAERSSLADSLASSLNQPESAKFQWAKVPKAPVGPSFEYCGMVNVKNNRGSYDGMQPFLATITTWNGNITGGAIAAINSRNREENREVIPRPCRQQGLIPYQA